MKVFGYARVSSSGQDLDVQVDEIRKFCEYRNFELIRLYTDKASGKDINRTGFTEMMTALDKNTLGINAVVVFKLDRIGRSLKNLIDIIDTFRQKNIQFICISDNFDTTTNQGILFFQLIGAIAEYERKLINERTALGRAAAITKGVAFGRREIKIDMDAVKRDIALGIPKSRLCKKYGIGKSTLYKRLEGKP